MILSRRGALGMAALLAAARPEALAGTPPAELRFTRWLHGETLALALPPCGHGDAGHMPPFAPAEPHRLHVGCATAAPRDPRPAPAGWNTLENLR
ncbi:hypothetical protein [Falsiroseomonas sp. CW058]|uniref:hypothetical protein n=1 Tax=Falsiroseomonas sp. CW058 TaxID=3388664 RepID=UPI003D31D380